MPTPDQAQDMGRRCTCFQLRRATRAVTSLYDRCLEPTGLKATQFTLLAALCGRPGLSMSKLGDLLGADISTLSRNAAILVREGLLVEQPGPNRRTKLLSLTALGEQRIAEATPLWEQAQQHLEALFPADSLREMYRQLRQITSHAEALHGEPALSEEVS